MYGCLDVWHGELILFVEKDFACLDGTNTDYEDTFPIPNIEIVC